MVADGIGEAELLGMITAVEKSPSTLWLLRSCAMPRTGACLQRHRRASTVFPAAGGRHKIAGRRVVVGTRELMAEDGVDVPAALMAQRDELASSGRTAVLVAVDGTGVGLIALADAARETSGEAVRDLHDLGVQVVMLSGDNQATATRIAEQIGIDTVVAEVLPAGKPATIAELQDRGRVTAMVGDGVNDAPALAKADLGVAIGAGTDVAIETADLVLMRSDPLDVLIALRIGRGTVRKMRQNLGWAVGYNIIALPIAAGAFQPLFGLVLRPRSRRCRCRARA